MYRAYQPLFPAASRYLQEKWDKTHYQEHRRKVEQAAPVVNTTALPTPLHLQVNLKKMQLEKECQATRGRDNLLHSASLGGIKQSRGRVDNWNFYCRHSLNWEKRQRDLEQIYWENRQLMKRLVEKKSELAQGHWQQHWHREQLIRDSLASYPHGRRSCQAGMERRRQRTGGSGSHASTCGGSPSSSPNRVRFPGSVARMGERFWGGRYKPAPVEQVTTAVFSPSVLRKKDATQPSGPLAQRSNKGNFVSAKDFSTKEADGSLAVPDLPAGAGLEKPVAEAAVASTRSPPSSCLREKLILGEEPSTHFEEVGSLSQTCLTLLAKDQGRP